MFKKLVKANRSFRGYDESYQIPRAQLLSFVDCARLAPSSGNVQPFKYFIASEKESVGKIQPLVKWAKALPELELPRKGMAPTAFIVICQDLTIEKSVPRFQKDVGIVAQTILLAATEKGLGGCMIGNYGASMVKNALDFPDHMMPVLIVALGKPKEKIILTELEGDGSTAYYRDDQDVHYVPKRKLEDIIL